MKFEALGNMTQTTRGFIRSLGETLLTRAIDRILPVEFRTIDMEALNRHIEETGVDYQ